MTNTKPTLSQKLASIPENKTVEQDIKSSDNDVTNKRSFLFVEMIDEVNNIDSSSQFKRRRSNAVASEEEALIKESILKTSSVDKVATRTVIQK